MKKQFESLSIYIHIPFCISKCAYCDFFSISGQNDNLIDDYVNALCNEIIYRIGKSKIKNCSTIYIGGGTPSLLSEKQFEKICRSIFEIISLDKNYEFTVEVNPDDVSLKLLKMLEYNKVNRLSCGIQSMNDEVLHKIKRRAGRQENLHALKILSENWKHNLSLDLISGLPGEDIKSFEKGLQEIIKINPNHISLYSLTVEEETPLGKMIYDGAVDYDSNFADEMWLLGRKILFENGYTQYEVSNFCRDNFVSFHNLVYWNHKDYLGCGSGATGTIYINGKGFRWTNKENISEYIEYWTKIDISSINESSIPQIVEIVSKEDSRFEFFMMGLRKLAGISEKDYWNIFKEKLPDNFIQLAKSWNEKRLMEIENMEGNQNYRLNKDGILFLNNFLEQLL